VHAIEGTGVYFEERARIARWVVDHANLSPIQVRRMLHELRGEWARFAWKNPEAMFEDYIDARDLESRASHRRGTIGLYVHGMLFSTGGIERLAAQLAKALVAAGYNVVVYCLDSPKARPTFPFPESVAVVGVSLDSPDGINRFADRMRRDKVAVFVPMLSESLFEPAIEAGLKAGARIIASEHNNPWRIETLWWSQAGRHAAFAKVDRIHLLSDRFVDSLPEPLRARVTIIPNGVPIGADWAATADQEAKRIVCIARLAPQKRIDLLVDAFAIVARARPGWDLVILGEGPLRGEIEAQVKTLGLADRILLPGVTDRVDDVLHGSAFFVLSSEFEGFPIAILEAMRAGLPCIAFASSVGDGILKNEVNGLLVPSFDKGALAEAMLRLVDDEAARRAYGRAASEGLKDFSLDSVLARWIDLVDTMAERFF
jgi:glycosyltransferase involved in cell wall biosynthesis